LGLTRKQFAEYEPLPATIMAINYWDNVGKTKPWLEAFAAICGIEMSNSERSHVERSLFSLDADL
jgi:pyrroloquinoline quinone (PQQ) biosynthesis protein C